MAQEAARHNLLAGHIPHGGSNRDMAGSQGMMADQPPCEEVGGFAEAIDNRETRRLTTIRGLNRELAAAIERDICNMVVANQLPFYLPDRTPSWTDMIRRSWRVCYPSILRRDDDG